MSWNILWGLGMDGRVDLTRIVSEARTLGDFDILCLQEVADGFSELEGSAGENQFAEIAALLPGYTLWKAPLWISPRQVEAGAVSAT